MTLINIFETTNNQSNIVIEETFDTFTYTSEVLGSDISFLYTHEYISSIFSNCNSRDNLMVFIDYESSQVALNKAENNKVVKDLRGNGFCVFQ